MWLASIATRVMPRVVMGSKASRRVFAGELTGNRLASAAVIRRTFFRDYGNPFPEPEFTPGETILLDATAWFVALALLYTPSGSDDTEQDKHMVRDDHRRLRAGKERLQHEKLVCSDNEEDPKKKTSSDHQRGH